MVTTVHVEATEGQVKAALDQLGIPYVLGGYHPVMKIEDAKYLQSFMHYTAGMEPTLYG